MKRGNRKALTLIELVIAMAMSSILVIASGMLLLGGHRAFRQMYASVHEPIRQDAKVLTAAFTTIGRKSNRSHYTVYEVAGNTFVEAQPPAGQTLASGQAVEFRYWDKYFFELSPSMTEMDVHDTGPYYGLFYLEEDKLFLDRGPVLNGSGGVQGGSRRTGNTETICLAENVVVTDPMEMFSHQKIGEAGNGCVSLNVTLENEDGDTVEIKTATFLRIHWPQ